MSESNEKHDEQESNEESSSGPQSNTIWGSAFVRISLYILLGFILLAVSRYVYLKVTDQYPATFEEQSIIQYPHLEQLQSNRNQKTDSTGSKTKTRRDGLKTESEKTEDADTLSQDGRRRE